MGYICKNCGEPLERGTWYPEGTIHRDPNVCISNLKAKLEELKMINQTSPVVYTTGIQMNLFICHSCHKMGSIIQPADLYDEESVTLPEGFVQTEHGHVFCNDCYKELEEKNNDI